MKRLSVTALCLMLLLVGCGNKTPNMDETDLGGKDIAPVEKVVDKDSTPEEEKEAGETPVTIDWTESFVELKDANDLCYAVVDQISFQLKDCSNEKLVSRLDEINEELKDWTDSYINEFKELADSMGAEALVESSPSVFDIYYVEVKHNDGKILSLELAGNRESCVGSYYVSVKDFNIDCATGEKVTFIDACDGKSHIEVVDELVVSFHEDFPYDEIDETHFSNVVLQKIYDENASWSYSEDGLYINIPEYELGVDTGLATGEVTLSVKL